MVLLEIKYILTLVIYQTHLHPGTLLVKNEQRPKLTYFLKKGQYLIWPVEGRFFTELTQLFWQTCFLYAKP